MTKDSLFSEILFDYIEFINLKQGATKKEPQLIDSCPKNIGFSYKTDKILPKRLLVQLNATNRWRCYRYYTLQYRT